MHERIAHDTWHKGRVVLLGDACHPMRPHMMSGASMAIEDAVILTRCLEKTGIHDFPKAFTRYKELRFDRISKVQRISSINTWLQKETDDPAWLFEYDPYQIEI
ncbi:FAD-dependent monooxygenase [Bartonella sp. DGB2]|uniref:FAD-dependent monooxygenase n=1 Tax=Bartonella sp. DGB2 TaxID=3388426 RepID=UPI00398FF4BF